MNAGDAVQGNSLHGVSSMVVKLSSIQGAVIPAATRRAGSYRVRVDKAAPNTRSTYRLDNCDPLKSVKSDKVHGYACLT